MATKPTPRVRMPATAKAGEVVEVKTLISHEMESGQRKDKDGKAIPRKIINKFAVKFNGKELMTVDWHTAISANPYQSFFVRVPESGTFTFEWTDDDGSVYSAEQKVVVS
jgi:sulfur-oxidizing protein SoxZ